MENIALLSDEDKLELRTLLDNLKNYYGNQYENLELRFISSIPDLRFSGRVIDNHIIEINEFHEYNHAERSLFHEFRHIWQRFNYPVLYNFWINCPEYIPGSFIYRNCSIERDARRYSFLNNDYENTDILDEWASNPKSELDHLKEVDPNKD